MSGYRSWARQGLRPRPRSPGHITARTLFPWMRRPGRTLCRARGVPAQRRSGFRRSAAPAVMKGITSRTAVRGAAAPLTATDGLVQRGLHELGCAARPPRDHLCAGAPMHAALPGVPADRPRPHRLIRCSRAARCRCGGRVPGAAPLRFLTIAQNGFGERLHRRRDRPRVIAVTASEAAMRRGRIRPPAAAGPARHRRPAYRRHTG